MSTLGTRDRLRLFGMVVRFWDGREEMHFDRDTFEIASDMYYDLYWGGTPFRQIHAKIFKYLDAPSLSNTERNELTRLVIMAGNQPIQDWERAK